MTTPSFGTLYNLEAIDSSSLVSLSSCPESVSYLTQSFATITPQGHQYINNYETQPTPVISLSDNAGEREFSVLESLGSTSYRLLTYTITTSFPQSITLLNSDDFDITTSASEILNFFFGIKKINDTLYCVYYSTANCNGHTNPGTDSHVRIRKISVTPGVGYSDDVVEEITLSHTDTYRWQLETSIVINKKGYIGLIRECRIAPNRGFYYSGYCLDMETDSVTLEFTYNKLNYYSDGNLYLHSITPLDSWTFNHGKSMIFYSSSGTLKWVAYYQDDIAKNNGGAYYIDGYGAHIMANGEDTLLEKIDYLGITTFHCEGVSINQYTSKDGVGSVRFTWPLDSSKNVIGRLHSDDTVSAYIPDSSAPLIWSMPSPIRSESIYPGIAKTSGGASSTLTTIDTNTGESTGTLSISGVTTIYTLFPTLDTGDNSLYVGVKMDDDSCKVLGINPSSAVVNTTIADIDFSGVSSYYFSNHGNFFVDWDFDGYTSSGTITYLLNFPTGNFTQAIMELN